MIDRDEAEKSAYDHICRTYAYLVDDLVIRKERTMERGFGWVFFYGSQRRISEGRPTYELVGAGAILVDKRSGLVRQLPTAMPTDFYIRRYEAEVSSAEGADDNG
jgi:hypothetical protein